MNNKLNIIIIAVNNKPASDTTTDSQDTKLVLKS